MEYSGAKLAKLNRHGEGPCNKWDSDQIEADIEEGDGPCNTRWMGGGKGRRLAKREQSRADKRYHYKWDSDQIEADIEEGDGPLYFGHDGFYPDLDADMFHDIDWGLLESEPYDPDEYQEW